jgi:hypothetical protein
MKFGERTGSGRTPQCPPAADGVIRGTVLTVGSSVTEVNHRPDRLAISLQLPALPIRFNSRHQARGGGAVVCPTPHLLPPYAFLGPSACG